MASSPSSWRSWKTSLVRLPSSTITSGQSDSTSLPRATTRPASCTRRASNSTALGTSETRSAPRRSTPWATSRRKGANSNRVAGIKKQDGGKEGARTHRPRLAYFPPRAIPGASMRGGKDDPDPVVGPRRRGSGGRRRFSRHQSRAARMEAEGCPAGRGARCARARRSARRALRFLRPFSSPLHCADALAHERRGGGDDAGLDGDRATIRSRGDHRAGRLLLPARQDALRRPLRGALHVPRLGREALRHPLRQPEGRPADSRRLALTDLQVRPAALAQGFHVYNFLDKIWTRSASMSVRKPFRRKPKHATSRRISPERDCATFGFAGQCTKAKTPPDKDW